MGLAGVPGIGKGLAGVPGGGGAEGEGEEAGPEVEDSAEQGAEGQGGQSAEAE